MNEDGHADLVLHYSRREIAAAIGDVVSGEVVTLTMTGMMKDGAFLEEARKYLDDWDLKAETEQVFGAPALLAKKAEQGEVDAVLNYGTIPRGSKRRVSGA